MGLWGKLSLDRIPTLVHQVEKICRNYAEAQRYETKSRCDTFQQEISQRADELHAFGVEHESDPRAVLFKKLSIRLRKVLQHRSKHSKEIPRNDFYPESTSSGSYYTNSSSEISSSVSFASSLTHQSVHGPAKPPPLKKQPAKATHSKRKKSHARQLYSWESGASFNDTVQEHKEGSDERRTKAGEDRVKQTNVLASFRIVLSKEDYYKYLRKRELHRVKQRHMRIIEERDSDMHGTSRPRQDSQFLTTSEPFKPAVDKWRDVDKSRWISPQGFRTPQ